MQNTNRDAIANERPSAINRANIHPSPNRNQAQNTQNSRHQPNKPMNKFDRMRTEIRQRV